MDTFQLSYYFDPFCGWCYGSSPVMRQVIDAFGSKVKMMPTGLFANENASPMTYEFAAFAWKNDQRIESLTNQKFSEQYRQQVLNARDVKFDSTLATRALTLINSFGIKQEFELLSALQKARYIDGLDTAAISVVTAEVQKLLSSLSTQKTYEEIETQLTQDPAVLDATQNRISESRRQMSALNINGVPLLVLETDQKKQLIQGEFLYSNGKSLIDAIHQELKKA